MSWQLKIQEPSGETRAVNLNSMAILGRGGNSTVLVKDSTLAPEAACIWPVDCQLMSSPFWIKVPTHLPAIRLGDLAVREAHIPPGIPFHIGESRFLIESASPHLSAPPFPSGVRPWLTCSETGKKILWIAKKAANTGLSIYVGGETGTGKEVISNLIHTWSPRKLGPFVPLHCGALPPSLVESELFGHVKGAFTGAIQHRPGALMQAHGGTLFLDEIGDLPLDIQVKLLRFLENGEIRPVGADRPSRADVRLICATHQPLEKLVKEGKFRRDLFYRIASITLKIPNLRSRPEDIEMLARKFGSSFGKSITPQGILRLKAYSWPGNVRELRHAIERASGLAGELSPLLHQEDFDFLLTPENLAQLPEYDGREDTCILTLKEMERMVVLKALKLTQGNRAKAARILGVARSTLFQMLKRHKIQGPKIQFEEFQLQLQETA